MFPGEEQQLGHRIFKKTGLHACGPVAARLLLVHQQAAGRPYGFLCLICLFRGVQKRRQSGKGAASVVLSVGEHHAPVEPAFPGPAGRDDLQLRAEKIFLPDSELPRQKFQNILLGLLVFQGTVSDQQVHFLRVEKILHLLFVPLPAQMGQQVREHERRVFFLLADGYAHPGSVLSDDDSVEGQRKGKPLVFFDSSVVVGIQVHIACLFIAGHLF